MALLILVRHGESEWNASGKLTGQADIALTEAGKMQARQVGKKLAATTIDVAYISQLHRAAQTFSEIQGQHQIAIPHTKHSALNERDFGSLTGKIKSDVINEIGADTYATLMHSWNGVAPEGESLEMVYERIVPYFKDVILKDLRRGGNVLVVSHHHALRALAKHLELMSDDEVAHLKLSNADALIYQFNPRNETFRKLLA